MTTDFSEIAKKLYSRNKRAFQRIHISKLSPFLHATENVEYTNCTYRIRTDTTPISQRIQNNHFSTVKRSPYIHTATWEICLDVRVSIILINSGVVYIGAEGQVPHKPLPCPPNVIIKHRSMNSIHQLIGAKKSILWSEKYAKFVSGWGSAPNLARGVHDGPQIP